jgi:CRISPR-associated endonuclease/helicase Cas3
LEIVSGPIELESLPRYDQQTHSGIEDVIARIRDELGRTDRPGRVLWVSNTVARAMQAYATCAQAGMPVVPRVYHSRFRYADRIRQHAAVIDSFRHTNAPAFAICTQVAEMSLDLSATLLVTDLATIPAIIQRLGRLNRHTTSPETLAMPFIVLEPVNDAGQLSARPYSIDELTQAKSWLGLLPQGASQRDLINYWGHIPESLSTTIDFRSAEWIEGGPLREVKPIRESSPAITVILEKDRDGIADGNLKLSECVLPMPWIKGCEGWPQFRGIPVAPAGSVAYSADFGARWTSDEMCDFGS